MMVDVGPGGVLSTIDVCSGAKPHSRRVAGRMERLAVTVCRASLFCDGEEGTQGPHAKLHPQTYFIYFWGRARRGGH